MILEPICFICKHFHKEKPGFECDAFKEIPEQILLGENDHAKPLPEQGNNIVFEQIEGLK